jgi:ribose transport system substrate-binding protein
VDAQGSSEKSYKLTIEFLRRHPKDGGILIAAADDTSALGELRAVRQIKCEKHVAIVGQDCTPDVMDEMKIVGTPLVAAVSREVHTYGPRLMQLGLALLRGQHIAPYHYVDHKLVTAEALIAQPSDTHFVPLSCLQHEMLR